MGIQEVDRRTVEVRDLAVSLRAKREFLTQERDKLRGRVEELDRLAQDLELVVELFRKINSDLTEKVLGKIDKIVTAGLTQIFDDRKISFHSSFSTSRGKPVVEFEFMVDGNRRTPSEVGGGVVAVTSTILRVIQVVMSKKPPYLFLDETLGPLSSRYRARAVDFLNKLAEKFGVTILIVTHPTTADELLGKVLVAEHKDGKVIYSWRG